MPLATEAEGVRRVLVDGLDLDCRSRRLLTDGRSIRLSSTEARLLQLLMRHVDEVVSHEEIFARVWGYDFNGNVNIIHTYISYPRRRRGVRTSGRCEVSATCSARTRQRTRGCAAGGRSPARP